MSCHLDGWIMCDHPECDRGCRFAPRYSSIVTTPPDDGVGRKSAYTHAAEGGRIVPLNKGSAT